MSTLFLDITVVVVYMDMGCQVAMNSAMVSAILHGNFRTNNPHQAHPFSSFNVPYTVVDQESKYNVMEIELMQSIGEGVPKDVIKELSKTNFVIPVSSHLLRHQLNNWYGVLQIVFGAKSLVALEAKKWVTLSPGQKNHMVCVSRRTVILVQKCLTPQ